jgi:hypothetical protein
MFSAGSRPEDCNSGLLSSTVDVVVGDALFFAVVQLNCVPEHVPFLFKQSLIWVFSFSLPPPPTLTHQLGNILAEKKNTMALESHVI